MKTLRNGRYLRLRCPSIAASSVPLVTRIARLFSARAVKMIIAQSSVSPPPYICMQLCEMPAPPMMQSTVVAFEHKVLIFGGKNANDENFLEDVLEFDLTTTEFKIMPSLPSRAMHMAGVRWGIRQF